MMHAKTLRNEHTLHNFSHSRNKSNEQNLNHDGFYDVVRAARQIVLQSYTHLHALAKTTSDGLLAIKPRVLPLNRHRMLPAHSIMDTPPGRTVSVLVYSLFHHKARLPKHVIIAKTAFPPNVIKTIDFNQLELSRNTDPKG